MTTGAPDRSEAAEYYFTYIDQVAASTDICHTLKQQGEGMLELLRGISDARSLHRYGPDKWSIREVVSHVSDTERVFVFRALWFARGFDSELPSFDQDIAVPASLADARRWGDLLDDFQAVRRATSTFFTGLGSEAWSRRGIASGKPFTVRALAYITAGHAEHHLRILRERYL